MLPDVGLQLPTPGDVRRLVQWLDDDEVNSVWYGRGADGIPLHVGYSPHQVVDASEATLQRIFRDENRKIFTIRAGEGEHIGEGQLEIHWEMQQAQVFILIGRKDLWHQHYGTVALVQLLDQAYENYGLHRVWADIPEYSEHALQMFRHLEFVLEGHLRKTHSKDGAWYDSFAVGLLADEYRRRRARLPNSPAS